MRIFSVVMLTIGILVLSTNAFPSDKKVYGIDLIEYGIYEYSSYERTKDDKSPSGYLRRIKGVSFVEKTEIINARIGKRFGIQFIIQGEPEGEEVDVEIVITLPPEGIKNPEKLEPIYKIQRIKKVKIGNINLKGYGFDNEYEIVPGKWVFQISYNNEVLLKKEFIIVRE